mmetsp:Transcript_73532/g.198871  ORF Transcript_73532/g.198871 Transcript_73532/m.198871 type:complete len:233 (-) Transcript_73532:1294-1992(-)
MKKGPCCGCMGAPTGLMHCMPDASPPGAHAAAITSKPTGVPGTGEAPPGPCMTGIENMPGPCCRPASAPAGVAGALPGQKGHAGACCSTMPPWPPKAPKGSAACDCSGPPDPGSGGTMLAWSASAGSCSCSPANCCIGLCSGLPHGVEGAEGSADWHSKYEGIAGSMPQDAKPASLPLSRARLEATETEDRGEPNGDGRLLWPSSPCRAPLGLRAREPLRSPPEGLSMPWCW